MTEWDSILLNERYSREEPDEIVVSFAELLKKEKRSSHVLDLGCGAGRHLVYMASQGFEVHGADISETGLKTSRMRLKKKMLEAHMLKCSMNSLPYVDSCFDAVICLRTIYHQSLRQIQETISQIHRILKREGLLLVDFMSKRTFKYGKGIKVEENTFVEQEGIERGVLHHFIDEEEIKHLFKSFRILKLELVEREVDGKLQSRWVLIAKT
ncbi:MAG: class I SAM-dependent methyltransferase [Candidatus Bathyarchaeia archaeon]